MADEAPADSTQSQASALDAQVPGSIPAGMPARLLIGLFEDTGKTWMKDSGIPWDVRYRYFTKGWLNNWGYSPADGSWGLKYMQECASQGFLPAIQYYQMQDEPGGGEDQFLAKVRNATTMKSYFSDFKVLMQRAKDFGKPVLVLVEADGYGLLQKQTNSDPNASAAIASSGLPELAGLPNTVAGWGLAFLQLRKAVGANNVILGIHISAWASSKDVAHFSTADALDPEVKKVHDFLKPFGLASNPTGATYDVLVGDPLDRDADFYRLTQGQDRWWDMSDSAPINSKSFNRYAEWLRLWNVASGKRWVLWQIPLGNSNHLNVDNAGSARQGYKDNRVEYFFGSGNTARLEKFAKAGVIAMLFGRGEGRQANYLNDQWTDGQLYFQSRAGAFVKAGGLAIPAGGGQPAPAPAPAPTPAPPPAGTSARYDFESGVDGWASSGAPISALASSTARAFAGSRSLEVQLAGTAAGKPRAFVRTPGAAAGSTITFRVWFPTGSRITAIQPYVQQGASAGWKWSGTWKAVGSLSAGNWNTFSVQVPADAATPLEQLGVEFTTDAAWTGSAYIDAVNW